MEFQHLKAVLFDLDGTLCDHPAPLPHAFRAALEKLVYGPDGVEERIEYESIRRVIGGLHDREIAKLLLPPNADDGACLEFMRLKEESFRDRVENWYMTPVSGLPKLKRWITRRKLKCAAITNATRESAELMIRYLGLKDYFQVIITGSDCDHAQPHPELYLKALEGLSVPKENAVLFEGTASGIAAGVAAGLAVIGLTINEPEDQLMHEKPRLVVKNYNDNKLWSALKPNVP